MGQFDRFSKGKHRLTEYDNWSDWLYFIIICTKGRLPYFGEVKDGVMVLSDGGIMVQDY